MGTEMPRRPGKTEPGSISLRGEEWRLARRLAHEDGIFVTELFRRLLRREAKRRRGQAECNTIADTQGNSPPGMV